MQPSPIGRLVSRQLCACRSQPLLARPRAPVQHRMCRRNTSYTAPPPTQTPADYLKRKYQRKLPTKDEIKAERSRTTRRMGYSAFGIALCAAAMVGAVCYYDVPTVEDKSKGQTKKSNVVLNDGPAVPDSVLEQAELVPTGTSSVPYLPRTINISSTPSATSQTAPNPAIPAGTTPTSAADIGGVEYQLLGLGIRTVSFLGIQVYVVGMYVASPDISKLQERLIRKIDPVATTLVPTEKSKLRDVLMDPEKSEEVWNEIIKDGGIRTAFKIVPTRNTDFMHMRDGFVRGITARATSPLAANDPAFQNESFGQSLNDFKTIFGGGSRKKVPYGHTLYLLRNAEGVFQAAYEDKQGVREVMGELRDERISRLLWLNYLAGKNVSSEDARKNIVEGCVEWTGRPVGTVATQVV